MKKRHLQAWGIAPDLSAIATIGQEPQGLPGTWRVGQLKPSVLGHEIIGITTKKLRVLLPTFSMTSASSYDARRPRLHS